MHDVHTVLVANIKAQMDAVLGDIDADCLKTGMLASAEVCVPVPQFSNLPFARDPSQKVCRQA